MPKVIVTNAKGLYQESGSGFDIAVSGSAEAGHIDLKCGSSSNKPSYIQLQDNLGGAWYFFVDTTGDLRVDDVIPSGSQGTIVGTQS